MTDDRETIMNVLVAELQNHYSLTPACITPSTASLYAIAIDNGHYLCDITIWAKPEWYLNIYRRHKNWFSSDAVNLTTIYLARPRAIDELLGFIDGR